jgi:hypothetical protein
MGFSRALYYPWIEVRDIAWLKSTILYWDEISTMVPLGFRDPYRTSDAKALADRGWLTPMYLHDDLRSEDRTISDAIADASGHFVRLLDDPLWRERLRREPPDTDTVLNEHFPFESIQLLSRDKHDVTGAERLQQFAIIHEHKLSAALLTKLLDEHIGWADLDESYRRSMNASLRGRYPLRNPWLRVNPDIAAVYLTILSNTIGERYGLAVVTDQPGLSSLTDTIRLGSPVSSIVVAGDTSLPIDSSIVLPTRGWYKAEAAIAEATLARCIFSTVTISEDTPVERVIRFRERHQDELDRFRAATGQLAKDLVGDYPTVRAFEEAVHSTYKNEIRPAITELEKARRGLGLKAGPDLIKAVTVAAPPSLVALLTLDPTGQVIVGTATAGLMVTALAVKYRTDKRSLLTNPYAYILAARDAFGEELSRQGFVHR